jgi:hypothetical protein
MRVEAHRSVRGWANGGGLGGRGGLNRGLVRATRDGATVCMGLLYAFFKLARGFSPPHSFRASSSFQMGNLRFHISGSPRRLNKPYRVAVRVPAPTARAAGAPRPRVPSLHPHTILQNNRSAQKQPKLGHTLSPTRYVESEPGPNTPQVIMHNWSLTQASASRALRLSSLSSSRRTEDAHRPLDTRTSQPLLRRMACHDLVVRHRATPREPLPRLLALLGLLLPAQQPAEERAARLGDVTLRLRRLA